MKNAPKYLQNHAQFNADDYAYLQAKGWTNKQIAERWDQEKTDGRRPCSWKGYGAKRKLAATLAASQQGE